LVYIPWVVNGVSTGGWVVVCGASLVDSTTALVVSTISLVVDEACCVVDSTTSLVVEAGWDSTGGGDGWLGGW
jgi:hypothetical protein